MCEILAFVGGSGSPGKTFLTLNTAVALAEMGLSATILDMGQSHMGLGSRFGKPRFYDVNDLLDGTCSLQDLPICMGDNLDLVSLGDVGVHTFSEKMSALIPMADRLESGDFLLIDTPPWIGQDLPVLTREISGLFAVVKSEQIATGEAYSLVDSICRSAGKKRISLVLNRVLHQGLTDMVCSRLENDLLNMFDIQAACAACVPEETNIVETVGERGLPNVISSESEAFGHIGRLAESIIYSRKTPEIVNSTENLFRKLSSLPKAENPLRFPNEGPQDGNGSDSVLAEVRMFREIIVGALGRGEDAEVADFAGLYQSVRTLMEGVPRNENCMAQSSAPPGSCPVQIV